MKNKNKRIKVKRTNKKLPLTMTKAIKDAEALLKAKIKVFDKSHINIKKYKQSYRGDSPLDD